MSDRCCQDRNSLSRMESVRAKELGMSNESKIFISLPGVLLCMNGAVDSRS